MIVSIIGAGRIGSLLSFKLLDEKKINEIRLIDIFENVAKGQALDLSHAAAIENEDLKVSWSTNYSIINGSDIVIITAGKPRTADMTRMDLLNANLKIIKDIAKSLKGLKKRPVIMVVTNPVDVLTYYLIKELDNYEWGRIFGFGSLLDTARFRYILSKEYGIPISKIKGLVIGQHGEYMVPLFSTLEFKVKNREEIREKLVKSAAEVISLKKRTEYGPIACMSKIINAIVNDKKISFPVSIDPYGKFMNVKDVSIGVPTLIEEDGVKDIINLELNEWEKEHFNIGVKYLKNIIKSIA